MPLAAVQCSATDTNFCTALSVQGSSDDDRKRCRGLEVVRACERVYLEAYTSTLLVEPERLVRLPPPLHSLSRSKAADSGMAAYRRNSTANKC